MAAPTKVTVVSIDPYHKIYGMLVPFLAQRLLESVRQLGDEVELIVPQFMSRLWAKDPGVLLLAAVDSAGHVKGYTAAVITEGQVMVLQPRLDEPAENDAVAEMVESVEKFAKSNNIRVLTLVSRKVDKKWLDKYGFEVTRYIMQKEIE